MGAIRHSYDDVRGVYALIPTPATPDADGVNAEFTVDLDETHRVVRSMVDDDVDALVVNGTFGEAATLTDEEWRQFTETVTESADGDVPTFAGPTTLDTRTTIERATYARDVGATGILLGRPMWCELSAEATLRFYLDVAEAVPELSILLYYNPGSFKNTFPVSLWDELADIPQVVGAKYGTVDDHYHEVAAAVNGRLRLLTVEHDWATAREALPDYALGCWSAATSCHPLPVTRLRDALDADDTDTAGGIVARMKASASAYYPDDSVDFERYVIPLTKARIDAAGYMDPGPARRPYHTLPARLDAGGRESGRLWADLAESLRVDAR